MTTTGAADNLAQQLTKAIGDADRRRRKHKQLSILVRLLVSSFTAAIPILLGLRVDPQRRDLLANVAMVVGGLATVLIAYEAFYGHRELWASNTAAATQLRRLESDLVYLRSKNADAVPGAALDDLHARFRNVLDEADSAWVGVRRLTAKQPAPQPVVPRKDD